jgi:hypothetical protein
MVVAVGSSRAFEDIFEYLDNLQQQRSSLNSTGSIADDIINATTVSSSGAASSSSSSPLPTATLRTCITCTVGNRNSRAKFTVHRPRDVIFLLDRLLGVKTNESEVDYLDMDVKSSSVSAH